MGKKTIQLNPTYTIGAKKVHEAGDSSGSTV